MLIDKCAGIIIGFQPINWQLELDVGGTSDRCIYIALGPFRLSLSV